MSATQDYVALDWIKGEVSQTLDQAGQALEAAAESPDDAGGMRLCLTSLHQVHGTMKMVELSGPAQVADEMEQLAQSLMNNRVPDASNAQEILMQTILQMPGYLDLIHREQSDSEQNYLPMVNNLRIARGAERIGGAGPEPEEAGPNLSPVLEAPGQDVVDAYSQANGEANVPKLRQRYRQALAALLKKTKARENLSLMGKVFSMLIKLCGESPIGNLSRLGIALVEGVATGAIRLGVPVAAHFKAIDAELGRLSKGGVTALSEPVSEELALGILEEISNAKKETTRIIAAKEIFAPAAGAVEVEQVTIGPDDETLAAVAKILIEELRDITDKLDLYVRASEPNVSNLVQLMPDLEQVSSTLVVVGLEQHQQAMSKQLEIIRGVEESGAHPDEETLLDMAKDLLEIEATLGSIVGGSDDGSAGETLGDLDEAQAAVVRETRIGLAQCRDALIEFVSSDFDHGKLGNLPDDLSVLKGGLLIVNQGRSGDVLIAASRYIKESLLKNKVRPELSAIDDLADAITSIDYYLERLLQSAHDPYIQMIEVAEAAVEKLGFRVGEQAPAVPEETEAEEAGEEIVEDDHIEAEETQLEPEPEPEIESEPEPEIESEPEPATVEATDDVDDEILDIFVEEVDEVLENIGKYFPQWQADFDGEEALEGLQRAFHTLKGSGRMVGATVLGDLAWSIEDMLNRVIDNSIQPGMSMVSVIADVIASVPEGLEQFKNQNQQAFKVDEMIARAEAITAGEEAPAAVEEAPVADKAPTLDEAPAEDLTAAEMPVTQEATTEEATAGEVSSEEEPPAELSVADEVEMEEAPAEEVSITQEAETEDATAEEAPVSEEIETGPVPATEETDQATVEEIPGAEPIEGFDLEDLEIDEETIDQPATVEDNLEDELEDIALDSADILEVAETEVEDEVTASEEEAEWETAAIGTTAVALTADELLESDDFELDDIFVAEANELIEVIQKFLDSPGEVSGELVAAFHTLKGSSAMAEIPSISTIAAPLEQLASQYLTQGSAPDAGFINAIEKGTGLIRVIVANLSEFRDSIEGMDTQVAETQAAQISSPETISEFDFENIRLLSEEKVVSSNWQEDHVVAVVAELEDAQEQSVALGQSELQALTTSLLRVYGQVQATPDETVISALKSGHDRLVIIFDRIAASQDVAKAADAIAVLDALEVGEVKEVEEDLPKVSEGNGAAAARPLTLDELLKKYS